MGCDIHVWLQRDEAEDWGPVWNLGFDRHYDLFGAMAGVRRDVEPVVPPRGIPKPSPLEYLEEVKWDYGHTHSWLYLEECEEVLRRVPSSDLEAAVVIMRHWVSKGHKPRLLFFFDN